MASLSDPRSVMSPMTGSTPIVRSTSASAGVRTRPRTRRPAFAAKRQMLEPSNPLAPVTRTLGHVTLVAFFRQSV
jgi:hypothetical protein